MHFWAWMRLLQADPRGLPVGQLLPRDLAAGVAGGWVEVAAGLARLTAAGHEVLTRVDGRPTRVPAAVGRVDPRLLPAVRNRFLSRPA